MSYEIIQLHKGIGAPTNIEIVKDHIEAMREVHCFGFCYTDIYLTSGKRLPVKERAYEIKELMEGVELDEL